jgi:hypothetical protein
VELFVDAADSKGDADHDVSQKEGGSFAPSRHQLSEDLSLFSDGLTIYTSCYSSKSYPNQGGKVWKNIIAQGPTNATVHTKHQAKTIMRKEGQTSDGDGDGDDEQQDDLHLHYNKTPAFSRKDGFVLGTNTVTGPYSFQMGIRGDMAYSIFLVCSFTGATSNGGSPDMDNGTGSGSMFKIYANTPGNNGVSMMVSATDTSGGEGQGRKMDGSTSLALKLRLLIADEHEIPCKVDGKLPLVVNSTHKYLFAIVKNYGRVQVSVLDLNDPDNPRTPLADVNIGSHSPVLFSNRDMTINEFGNWQANIQAFGCYDRAISDRDTTKLYHHYRQLLKQFDPTHQRMIQEMDRVNKIKSCPFDADTCDACRGVDDWSNFQKVFVADDVCKAAIAKFCANNPSHDRCSCWSVNHPAYNTSCKVYRCAIGGPATQHECAPKPEDRPTTQADLRQMLVSVMKEKEVLDEEKKAEEKKNKKDKDGEKKRASEQAQTQSKKKEEESKDRREDKSERDVKSDQQKQRELAESEAEAEEMEADGKGKGFFAWLFGY